VRRDEPSDLESGVSELFYVIYIFTN